MLKEDAKELKIQGLQDVKAIRSEVCTFARQCLSCCPFVSLLVFLSGSDANYSVFHIDGKLHCPQHQWAHNLAHTYISNIIISVINT